MSLTKINLSHTRALELITLAHTKRLSPAQHSYLSAHLESCPDCREVLEVYNHLRDSQPGMDLDTSTMAISDATLRTRYLRQRRLKGIMDFFANLAWSASAVVLVVMLIWTINNLRSQPGLAPASSINSSPPSTEASQPGLAPASSINSSPPSAEAPSPGNTSQSISALDIQIEWYTYFAWIGILLSTCLGVPGILLGGLRSRFKAVRLWMLITEGFIILACAIQPIQIPSLALYLQLFAFMSGSLAISALIHLLWSEAEARSINNIWITSAFLITALGALILGYFLPSLEDWQRDSYWFLPFTMFFSGLIPPIFWRLLELQGRWRWVSTALMVCSLFLIVIFSTDSPDNIIFRLPDWFTPIFFPLGFLWPSLAILVTGRIVHKFLTSPQQPGKTRMIAQILLVAVLYVSVISIIRTITISEMVSEGQIMHGFILNFTWSGVLLACIALAWKMTGRRKILAVLCLLVMGLTILPAGIFPSQTPHEITLQRLEKIDQAILEYHEDKRVYPSQLNNLFPKYLQAIPSPLSYHDDNVWCYESGEDYYRLGYFYSPRDGPRVNFSVYKYVEAGTAPDPKWACEYQLEQEIQKRWKWEP